MTVYEVTADCNGPGRYDDGIEIARFRSKRDAEAYAAGRTCYGGPATVQVVDVPRKIAARWGLA